MNESSTSRGRSGIRPTTVCWRGTGGSRTLFEGGRAPKIVAQNCSPRFFWARRRSFVGPAWTQPSRRVAQNLFTGAYMAFRNPRAHRELAHDLGAALGEFLLLNQLYLLEMGSERYDQ